jgi:hypothetical protein
MIEEDLELYNRITNEKIYFDDFDDNDYSIINFENVKTFLSNLIKIVKFEMIKYLSLLGVRKS